MTLKAATEQSTSLNLAQHQLEARRIFSSQSATSWPKQRTADSSPTPSPRCGWASLLCWDGKGAQSVDIRSLSNNKAPAELSLRERDHDRDEPAKNSQSNSGQGRTGGELLAVRCGQSNSVDGCCCCGGGCGGGRGAL